MKLHLVIETIKTNNTNLLILYIS